MLLGEFQYIIDEKGRIFIPAKFREELGAEVVVSKGFDDCLFIHSIPEFEKFTEEIDNMDMIEQRNVIRIFYGASSNLKLDKQGRINIPQTLRDYAGLTKDIVVIGANRRAEVWDKEKWDAINSSELTSQSILKVMQAAKKNARGSGI